MSKSRHRESGYGTRQLHPASAHDAERAETVVNTMGPWILLREVVRVFMRGRPGGYRKVRTHTAGYQQTYAVAVLTSTIDANLLHRAPSMPREHRQRGGARRFGR